MTGVVASRRLQRDAAGLGVGVGGDRAVSAVLGEDHSRGARAHGRDPGVAEVAAQDVSEAFDGVEGRVLGHRTITSAYASPSSSSVASSRAVKASQRGH